MQSTHERKHHPTERTYVKVAIFLAIVTAVEIWLSYAGFPDLLTTILLILMGVLKFYGVVMWFMHLKFDNPVLRKPFMTGIVIALIVYTVVLVSLIYYTP